MKMHSPWMGSCVVDSDFGPFTFCYVILLFFAYFAKDKVICLKFLTLLFIIFEWKINNIYFAPVAVVIYHKM